MTSAAPPIALKNPATLCAAVPHLLGFTPRESVVVLWLSSGRILLTQRVDLPQSSSGSDEGGQPPPGDVERWIHAVWCHAAARESTEILCVIVTEEEVSPRVTTLAEAITEQARRTGLVVRDLILLQRNHWRSLLCADPECCPAPGTLIPPALRAQVARAFGSVEPDPTRDRAWVVDQLARDDGRAAQVAQVKVLVGPGPRRLAARERWRDSALGNLRAWLAGPSSDASAGRRAHLLAGLADVRVRDCVLWDLGCMDAATLVVARGGLIDLVCSAPTGHTAPVATVTAVACWLEGDGVRAGTAVERALEDDPGYALAVLVDASLRAGLAPDTWRQAMGELTFEVCRYGLA